MGELLLAGMGASVGWSGSGWPLIGTGFDSLVGESVGGEAGWVLVTEDSEIVRFEFTGIVTKGRSG